jgi:hypothetical protein
MISRCPFAILGLDSDQMAACPGYEGEVVSFALSAAGTAAQGRTCLHVGAEPAARGFAGGCHHPEAEVVLPMAAALCRADITRNRPRVVIDPAAEAATPAAEKGSVA